MAQLQSPETYVDGQQVTATRLNNQTNGATLLPGAITDQTNLTANTVASGDSVLLYDLSATALREATAGDLLGSNVPVTTSAITAGANSDVVITPNDGVVVTGNTYVSADAITVTVTTAVAHGLSVNQVVQIYGAGTGYGGVFKITAVTSLTFTYVLSSLYSSGASITTTPTACSYYTKGTNRVSGHSTISGNQYASNVVTSYLEVNTQALFNTATVTGASTFTGAVTFTSAPLLGTTAIKPRLDYFVQTRDQAEYLCNWGGAQNPANPYGTRLALADITFTPQKAGNRVVLEWSLFGEGYNGSADMVFLVTRTPNTGAGAGVPVHLPDAVDASNNTWSGVTTCGYDANDSTTPSVVTVKIVDFNSLNVSSTYSVYVRPSSNAAARWFFNRAVGAAGGFYYETGLSLGHAQEIYV